MALISGWSQIKLTAETQNNHSVLVWFVPLDFVTPFKIIFSFKDALALDMFDWNTFETCFFFCIRFQSYHSVQSYNRVCHEWHWQLRPGIQPLWPAPSASYRPRGHARRASSNWCCLWQGPWGTSTSITCILMYLLYPQYTALSRHGHILMSYISRGNMYRSL